MKTKAVSIKDKINKFRKNKKFRKSAKFNVQGNSKEDLKSSINFRPDESSFISVVNDSATNSDYEGEDAVDRVGLNGAFDFQIPTSTGLTSTLPTSSCIRRTSSTDLSNKKAKKRKLQNYPSDDSSSSNLYNATGGKLNDSTSSLNQASPAFKDEARVKKRLKSGKFSISHFFDDGHSSNNFDSRILGENCLKWLINPYTVEDFKKHCWEKAPLYLKRNQKDYYGELFSTKEMENIIKNNDLEYTRNIDIAVYKNDERFTYNPDGKVYPALVWNKYQEGCSIRLLNPQTYSKNVWKLCSILQEFFHSFVGANVYLTPPNSQGFAPHYDDIEAFILQLEGKKIWKVYSPLDEETTLPRFSSKNFKRSDLTSSPINTFELEPGDLLYFPRGFIHEGRTSANEHSLHITISCSQKHTFGDLFETLIPQAISVAMQEDLDYRESLPISYLNYMGLVNQESNDRRRDEFLNKVKNLFSKLINYVNVDLAVDHFSKEFIHSALPPVLTSQEKKLSIIEGGESWHENKVKDGIQIELDTEIKLVRYGCCRIVVENEDSVRLYHTLENSRIYQEKEAQYVEIPSDLSVGVEFVINNYPNLCTVREIPLDNLDDRLEVANLLFDKGLIVVNENCLKLETDL